jgi:hypothetical protein
MENLTIYIVIAIAIVLIVLLFKRRTPQSTPEQVAQVASDVSTSIQNTTNYTIQNTVKVDELNIKIAQLEQLKSTNPDKTADYDKLIDVLRAEVLGIETANEQLEALSTSSAETADLAGVAPNETTTTSTSGVSTFTTMDILERSRIYAGRGWGIKDFCKTDQLTPEGRCMREYLDETSTNPVSEHPATATEQTVINTGTEPTATNNGSERAGEVRQNVQASQNNDERKSISVQILTKSDKGALKQQLKELKNKKPKSPAEKLKERQIKLPKKSLAERNKELEKKGKKPITKEGVSEKRNNIAQAQAKMAELKKKMDELSAKPTLSKSEMAKFRNYKKKLEHEAFKVNNWLNKAKTEAQTLADASAGLLTEEVVLPAEDAQAIIAENKEMASATQAMADASALLISSAVDQAIAGVAPDQVLATVEEASATEPTLTSSDLAVDASVTEAMNVNLEQELPVL